MAKTSNKVIDVVKSAVKLGESFVSRELVEAGHTINSISKGIEEGYLKRTKQVLKTGKRGKPATVLVVTAKGKKAAAK